MDKKALKRFLYSIILVIFVLELGLRIYLLHYGAFPKSGFDVYFSYYVLPKRTPFDRYTIWEYDNYTIYRLKPNKVIEFNYANIKLNGIDKFSETTDSEGLRADSCGGEIWLIGDSFTFSYSVNDNKTITANLCNKGYKVKNLGIPGFSTIQSMLMAKKYIDMGKKPEKIIYLLYVGNDMRDNEEYLNYKEKLPGTVEWVVDSDFNVKERITREEDLSDNAKEKIRMMSNPLVNSFVYSYLLSIEMLKKYGVNYIHRCEIPEFVKEIKYDKKQIKVLVAVLKYANRIFNERGVDFYVYVIPSREQACIGTDKDINKEITSEINRSGIKVIDKTEEYYKKCKEELIYHYSDLHFNEKGYKLTAEFIENDILSK